MTVAAGSLAIGLLVFLLATRHVEPRWSRPLVRHRLQHVSSADTPSLEPLELAALLDAVGRTMHAGSSLAHALLHAADTQPHLAPFTEPIVLQCMRGVPVARAIDELGAASWSVDVNDAARALALASLNNAPSVVHHGADLIRERGALLAERATRSAQATASLRVLTRSPLVVAALIVAMSNDARRFLLASPTGLLMVVTGLALHTLGRRWMRRLIVGVAP